MPTSRPFDIRLAKSSDPANLMLGNYAFATTPQIPNKEEDEKRLQRPNVDRIFFSYLENEPVARVAVIPMTLNVRGKVMPMGGVSGVCSMPAARRGGHIRALLQHSLEDMHAQGQAVSTLFPFKTSFYQMFGYAGWQAPLWARIEPRSLAPYLHIPKSGVVKQRLSNDAADDLYTFLQRSQQDVHGMSNSPRTRFNNIVERYPTWFMSVHEDDQITGGMCYKMNLDKGVMEVVAVFWNTRNGMLNVLDFMARHVDQVKIISMPVQSHQHPQLWVTDDSCVTLLSNEEGAWDAPMGRVVSVPGLSGIGAGDATASIIISDPHCPWNEGTWTLSGVDGALTITPGGESGGEVSIAGLAAMVFSGMDPTTLPYRGWGSVDSKTADALQTIFPAVVPHLSEQF